MQARRNLCVQFRRSTLALLTIVIVLVVLAGVDRLRNAVEEYSVYSAYLSKEFLTDDHDWGADVPIQVVVADTTEVSGIFRLWALHVAKNQLGFDSLSVSTRASFIVRNLYHTRILPKFAVPKRATIALASPAKIRRLSDTSEFHVKFPHSWAYVILS